MWLVPRRKETILCRFSDIEDDNYDEANSSCDREGENHDHCGNGFTLSTGSVIIEQLNSGRAGTGKIR